MPYSAAAAIAAYNARRTSERRDRVFARRKALLRYAQSIYPSIDGDYATVNTAGGPGFRFFPKTERAEELFGMTGGIWGWPKVCHWLEVLNNREVEVVLIEEEAETMKGNGTNKTQKAKDTITTNPVGGDWRDGVTDKEEDDEEELDKAIVEISLVEDHKRRDRKLRDTAAASILPPTEDDNRSLIFSTSFDINQDYVAATSPSGARIGQPILSPSSPNAYPKNDNFPSSPHKTSKLTVDYATPTGRAHAREILQRAEANVKRRKLESDYQKMGNKNTALKAKVTTLEEENEELKRDLEGLQKDNEELTKLLEHTVEVLRNQEQAS